MKYPRTHKFSCELQKDTREERGLRFVVVLLFAIYLSVGVIISGDYGASWDEPLNRDLGLTTFNYVLATISGDHVPWAELSQGLIAEQGPFFETVLAAVEAVIGLQDSGDILRMRHLATFLAYWLGTIAFYTLLRRRFNDRKIALAGVALLVLTPRLFAHSFYNSKDAVLTALFMIGLLTMMNFVREQSVTTAILHGLVCAAAVAVRMVGLLLPVVTLIILALSFAGVNEHERNWKQTLQVAAVYAALLTMAVYLFWPALWERPVGGFLDTLRSLASARQMDNSYSLYLGQFVRVDQLPWHYLPLWMVITLPLAYLFLFVTGVWVSIRGMLRESLFAWENVQNIAFSLLFFVPVLAVILIRPVIYDDWRHLYFVYPAFLVIGLTGFRELYKRPISRNAARVLLFIAIIHGAGIIVRYHPYQNVYFNALAGREAEAKFELDYWGLSFREGLEYVLRTDPSDPVKVAVSDYPGEINAWLLDRSVRQRLQIVPLAFLSNHRQPGHYADFYANKYPCVNRAYDVRVDGTTLLGVYKLHSE